MARLLRARLAAMEDVLAREPVSTPLVDQFLVALSQCPPLEPQDADDLGEIASNIGLASSELVRLLNGLHENMKVKKRSLG